jgi:transcriptional regulator with XRE-family HTH domain
LFQAIMTFMDDQTIKHNIAKIRLKMGLSQRAFGELLGISRLGYRNIELGSTKIMNPMLDKIAEIAHISNEELILGYQPDKTYSLDMQKIINRQKERIQNLTNEYEDRIEELNKEIRQMKRLNDSLEEDVRTKNMLISMRERMNKKAEAARRKANREKRAKERAKEKAKAKE